jgi:hypothetical protein
MTEAEWLACTDPQKMLDVVRGPKSVRTKVIFGREVPCEGFFDRRTSDRKLRLLACACCRRLWRFMDDDHSKKIVEVGQWLGCGENLLDLPLDSCRRAVELAELAADDPLVSEKLRVASEAADAFHVPPQQYADCYDSGMKPFDTELMASGHAAYAAYYACDSDAAVAVSGVVREAAHAVAYLRITEHRQTEEGGDSAERAVHCALLREIIGNPFRPITFDPACLTPKVTNLTTVAYKERVQPLCELDSARLGAVADALEEAGCTNTDILSHLRGPGPHVRGCWVVDLILGKE